MTATQLLSSARVADLAASMPAEYAALVVSIRRESQRLANASAQTQWIAAIHAHGSERDALAAARAELADVTARLAVCVEAEGLHRDGLKQLRADARLNEARSSLAGVALDMSTKQRTLAEAIQQAEARRAAKVAALVEEGVPAEMAQSIARPSLAELAAMQAELEAMPGKSAAVSQVLKSAEALVLHAYPEAATA